MEHTQRFTHKRRVARRAHTHTQAEAEQHEAIFHCYYEQAREPKAHTADLHSGSQLVTERVCLNVVSCCLLQMCICTSEFIFGSDLYLKVTSYRVWSLVQCRVVNSMSEMIEVQVDFYL